MTPPNITTLGITLPKASVRRITFCAVALWALISTGCDRSALPSGSAADNHAASIEPPRRVFLITVDTLRADHLSAYGYPRATTPELDRWAERGVLFERAIAQWPKTGASFASIFTGRYPQSTGLTHKAAIRIPESYLTLPAFIQQLGYTTLAVVSNGVLSDDLGWSRGFDRYLETWGDTASEDPEEYRKVLYAGRVNELALPLVEEHAAADKLFVWLHYSDPHAPYVLPEGFDNPFLGDPYDQGTERVDLAGTRGRAIGSHRELSYYVAQYDANIRVVDHYIDRALEHFESLGLLDDSLIVFTADHGESLGEHDSYFEHGPQPYNTTSHVPLFMLREGVIPAGRRIAEPNEMLDLYPTLIELLAPGLSSGDLVPGLEGRSQALPILGLTMPDDSPPRLVFAEAGRAPRHYRSVQDQSWKLVYRQPPPRRRPGPENYELYRIDVDPLEARNIAAEHRDDLVRLRRPLLDWMAKARPDEGGTGDEDGELSEEARKALRALGYVN